MKIGFLSVVAGLFFFCVTPFVQAAHPLINFFEAQQTKGKWEHSDWNRFRELVSQQTTPDGKITSEIQEALTQIEVRHYDELALTDQGEFRAVLAEIGGRFKNLTSAVAIPAKQTPFWIEKDDELKKFRSSPSLPAHADIVIIGAGLTGSSAAYHLIEAAQHGKSIVILEADHPAYGSSGRNGGNFQLLPETYLGKSYEGLIQERLKWLSKKHPDQDPETLYSKSKEQAEILARFSFLNMKRIKQIVKNENIQCDISENGWLRMASSADGEKALISELPWLESMGAEGVGVLSSKQIQDQLHLPAQFSGRLIRGSGNYHPYKFTKGVIEKTLEHGIQLYNGVKVSAVTPRDAGGVSIETNEGPISADRAIVATNAFTSQIFPELKGIECVPSQVVTLEHMPNHLKGFTITERNGDIYFNMPRATHTTDLHGNTTGMLLYGLDFSGAASNPHSLPPSQELLKQQLSQIYERFPETTGQPASRVWAGPMGFSEDRVPSIGFLSKDIIIAAGFQGYGGSYCIEAGCVAAQYGPHRRDAGGSACGALFAEEIGG